MPKMQDDDDVALGLGPSDREDAAKADFDAAASFLISAVTSKDKRFTDKLKLQLYGLFKQAVSGKCSASKPALWDPPGRAKW